MLLRAGIFSRRLSSIVPPPFLYGHRHPLIAGLIRFDDEISNEAQRVLQTAVFSQNNFFSKISTDAVRLVEIVSDETVSKSHNRTLIESGTGVMIKTTLTLPGTEKIPVGISLGFHGVGISNDSKQYHGNQVRTFSNEFLTDSISETNNSGIVLICHDVSDADNNTIDLLPGHEIVAEILDAPIRSSSTSNDTSSYSLVELSSEECAEIYAPCVQFGRELDDTKFLALRSAEGDLICGGSVTANKILTDPFVTLDCPEGEEKRILEIFSKKFIGAKKIVFSSSDKFTANLFPNENVRYVVSAKPVGDITDEQFSLLQRRPWVLQGLLV